MLDGPISTGRFLAWVQQCLVPTLISLPPYSPNLNPIEQVFAKLKALLRRVHARTVTDTSKSIGNGLDAFSSAACATYVRRSGYAAT